MNIYQLPDKNLVIPLRAESGDGLIGDTTAVIGPDNPLYTKYVEWFNRTNTNPIPISSWPLPNQGAMSLSIGSTDDYPRDNAERFIDKYLLAEAARDPEKAVALRESLREEHHLKLDYAIAQLQAGQTIHHPRENPGLGVDINGEIADPRWAAYQQTLNDRNNWEGRRTVRDEDQKTIEEFVKTLRGIRLSGERPWADSKERDAILDELDEAVKVIGTSDADIRKMGRLRYRATNRDDYLELEDFYEDAAEAAHQLLEEEAKLDLEPPVPAEPTDE